MIETVPGSCHCGAVAFAVRFDGPIETSKCNCSICQPTRYWKAIVSPDAFTLERGSEVLSIYEFGPRKIRHHFCGKCGVKLHGIVNENGTALVAISVPTLDLSPDRLAALPVSYQDGAHDDKDHAPAVTTYL